VLDTLGEFVSGNHHNRNVYTTTSTTLSTSRSLLLNVADHIYPTSTFLPLSIPLSTVSTRHNRVSSTFSHLCNLSLTNHRYPFSSFDPSFGPPFPQTDPTTSLKLVFVYTVSFCISHVLLAGLDTPRAIFERLDLPFFNLESYQL
jgi:hypothetical protein